MNDGMDLRQQHIGLNAHLLNLSGNYRSAGINWYIYHLLQNLSPTPDLKYTVFLNESRAREHFRLDIVRSQLPTFKPIVRILWEQFAQPFALKKNRIDLLHALAFAGPLATTIPWIATVYDLSFMLYPQSFNTANRVYLTWGVRHSLRHADRVIAISASTKRDMVRLFGASPNKIDVVYCASDDTFTPAKDPTTIAEFRRRKNLPEKFILHVGTIEPRKNLARLVRAFARAKRSAKFPHCLVLVGARGWKYADVDAAIEQADIKDAVIFAGYAPQNELPLWYQIADLFAYPSIYEGFGLPPLEAMACGTPVVTSNASAIPEVVGDAAITVAPDDEAALGDAIIRVLTDHALYEQMVARGLAQAKKFSWERAAKKTTAIYRAVLSQRPGAAHVLS
ncbi:MAG: glycosyltransferase family 4 protein [Chloroflexi bacterium]|nr:glycosyltransferase family 4 protein [Chloroflexota bacterium]